MTRSRSRSCRAAASRYSTRPRWQTRSSDEAMPLRLGRRPCGPVTPRRRAVARRRSPARSRSRARARGPSAARGAQAPWRASRARTGGRPPLPSRVAERVVDLLEVVEIEEEDGPGGRFAPPAGERLARVLDEHRAVGEPVPPRPLAGAGVRQTVPYLIG